MEPLRDFTHTAAVRLELLRQRRPLVHNITNYVAMDLSANALLALGAAPAMVHAIEEVEDFVALADALVLNVGTPSPVWADAMHRARRAAMAAGIPVVLDPVGAGATRYRTELALALLRGGVSAVRANASEVLALVGEGAARGVDAAHAVEAAQQAARALALEYGVIVCATGAVDFVTDGSTALHVHGGSGWMPKVTAMGCAASACVAAFLAVESEPAASLEDRAEALAVGGVHSAAGALACFAAAGERAEALSAGPGTFRAHFLDALAGLTSEQLIDGESAVIAWGDESRAALA